MTRSREERIVETQSTETGASDAHQSKARRSPLLTVVTDSELQTWRACHQLHDFKYRQRLRPLVAARPLAIGSIFHTGMASGLRAGWVQSARSMPTTARVALQIAAATQDIDALVMKWAGTIVAHSTDVDFERLQAEVDETAAMVKWMLDHYFRATSLDLSQYELIEVERAFRVPMRDRRGNVVSHLVHDGVRDAAVFDPTYNAVVLFEHKTTANDPRGLEKRVELDTQGAGYINALLEEHAKDGLKLTTGETIPRDARFGRVAYNGLRKALPKAPKVNKDGKVSVAACTTTPDLYRAALDEQVTKRRIAITADQQTFLDELAGQGDRYFSRVEWERTREDLERWRSDALVDARRIRSANRNVEEGTRNPGNCNMAWSPPCPFKQLCLNPNAPELRRAFRVIDEVHEEVRAAEVETAV
jgi:hypothetical protein